MWLVATILDCTVLKIGTGSVALGKSQSLLDFGLLVRPGGGAQCPVYGSQSNSLSPCPLAQLRRAWSAQLPSRSNSLQPQVL